MGAKLTKRFIDELQPRDTTFFVWDSVVPGLGVCVTAKGSKSFVVQYRTRSTGRARRMVLGSVKHWDLTVARSDARRVRTYVDQGGDPNEDQREARAAPTISELIEVYREQHLSKKSKATKKAYRFWLRHIEDALGTKKVADVTMIDIERLRDDLFDQPTTSNRVVAVAGSLFSFAIKHKHRENNPCRGVERFHEVAKERYLSRDERSRLIGICQTWPDRTSASAVLFALFTGARKGEVMSLSWDQIDLERRTWTKPATMTKQKRKHTVQLGQPAVDLLLRMPRHVTHPFKCVIDYQWPMIRAKADLEDVRFHDLRHDHASLLIEAGASLHVVGSALGHSKAATTFRYAHVADKVLREAIDRASEHYSETREKADIVTLNKSA